MSDDFYRRLVKPIRDAEIEVILDGLPVDKSYPWDQQLNFAERIGPIRRFISTARDWLKQELVGLEQFPFAYVMNGNTDSLNHLILTNHGKFGWYHKEYTYYRHLCSKATHDRTYVEMQEPEEVDHLFTTWPGYTNGDSLQADFAKTVPASMKHLDVAYAALTRTVGNFDVTHFQTVSVSFSKTLAIPFNRIGILFSKKEISSLDVLNKLGYVNIAGANAATAIMQAISPNHWRNKYGEIYDSICADNSITPTECFLFGYHEDGTRIGLAPYFKGLIAG